VQARAPEQIIRPGFEASIQSPRAGPYGGQLFNLKSNSAERPQIKVFGVCCLLLVACCSQHSWEDKRAEFFEEGDLYEVSERFANVELIVGKLARISFM